MTFNCEYFKVDPIMFNKYLKRMYAHEKSLSHFYLGIEKNEDSGLISIC